MSDKILVVGKRFKSEDEVKSFLVENYGKGILENLPTDALASTIYFRTNWDYFDTEFIIGNRMNDGALVADYVERFDGWWKRSFGDEPYSLFVTEDQGMYN